MHWRLKFVLTAQHSSGKKRKNKIYKCKKTSLCLRIKDRYIYGRLLPMSFISYIFFRFFKYPVFSLLNTNETV